MGQRRDLLYGMRSFERGKLVSARDAVQLIQDGDTVATTGFVGIGFPENIAVALEKQSEGNAQFALGRPVVAMICVVPVPHESPLLHAEPV